MNRLRCLIILFSVVAGSCVTQPDLHHQAALSTSKLGITDAMKMTVEQEWGMPVIFSGNTNTVGDWAYFDGHACPADGSEPDGEMALDFGALLRRDSSGNWKVLEHGFSGDPGFAIHAYRSHRNAPAAVFPSYIAKHEKNWPR